MSDLDCGDNSCKYAKGKGGMRTNGGCRCDECPFCGRHLGGVRKAGHTNWCQWRVRVQHLAELNGLTLIGPEDAAVLEACAKLDLRQHPAGPVTCYGGDRDVELAEWERRRAAKETPRG